MTKPTGVGDLSGMGGCCKVMTLQQEIIPLDQNNLNPPAEALKDVCPAIYFFSDFFSKSLKMFLEPKYIIF